MYSSSLAWTTHELAQATIKLPASQVHSKHPFRDAKNHDKLLCYVRRRLDAANQIRLGQLGRYARIDRDVAAWQKYDEEDQRRDRKQNITGEAQVKKMNLPLNFVHLDDLVTYFAQTFSPTRGMFYHTAKPDETQPAHQIVTLMNNHSIYAGYYSHVLMTLGNLAKYNLGGFHVTWSQDIGPKLSKDSNDKTVVNYETTWQGNRVEALDMYNVLIDPSVEATQVHRDGEFVAKAEIRSRYWLQNEAAKGNFFNVEELFKADAPEYSKCKYYRNPIVESKMDQDDSKGKSNGSIDYDSWFREGPALEQTSGFELVTTYIRINPNDFGLIDGTAAQRAARSRYEVWRIVICNDSYIIDASYMNNIHGMLPMCFGYMNQDIMGRATKSTAEIIQPLQDFASFLLNVHVKASRKKLWGRTYYDPSAIDMSSIPQGEVAAEIPLKASAHGKDIRTAVYTDNNDINTDSTVKNLGELMQILNEFFPTQMMPSQIASIDRAVSDQVAAVQQGSNRRQHKTARLLDDTLFRNMRFMCYYNILQYQSNGEVTDFYGKTTNIDLDALRQTDLPFIIGQGLKAIDRMAAANNLQQVIFALIQNPNSAAQIDVLALIDYWTSMIDIDVDMKQFRIQQQMGAGQAPAQGAANDTGVQPVTDPAQMTGPLT